MLRSNMSAGGGASQSYATILKSSAVMGISFAVVMILSFIRMKVMAVLLGPSGVGLLGLMSSVLELCVAIAGLGVQQSGIRQIAAAPDDAFRRKVSVALRWLSLGLGMVGGAVLLLAAVPISELTFGSASYAPGVTLLALALFLRIVSGGRLALLQGMRRINVLARINIFAALLSTAVCIPLVYLWREQSIAPAILAMAGAAALVTWFLSRTSTERELLSWTEMVSEGRGLLNLGMVFMASTILTTGAAYLARITILQHAGIDGAGLYQAAWAVGVLYSGFILQAMGSDFYPRLSALAHDDRAINQLVNEQIRVSILLAAPGVLGTITLAQLVMHLFYAVEFEAAANTLRWICVGTFLQTLAWPAGFVMLAKGHKRAFFWLEVVMAVVQVGLTFLLVPIFGHEGAGIAFCSMYVVHTLAVAYFAGRSSGFRWSEANVAIALGFLALIGAVFAAFQALEADLAVFLGVLSTILAGCLSLFAMLSLVPADAIPPALRPLLARFSAQR